MANVFSPLLGGICRLEGRRRDSQGVQGRAKGWQRGSFSSSLWAARSPLSARLPPARSASAESTSPRPTSPSPHSHHEQPSPEHPAPDTQLPSVGGGGSQRRGLDQRTARPAAARPAALHHEQLHQRARPARARRRRPRPAAAGPPAAGAEPRSSKGLFAKQKEPELEARGDGQAEQVTQPVLRNPNGTPTPQNPGLTIAHLRPRSDRRPEPRHRLVRDPALPAADLPVLRDRVRDPLAGARLYQQDRDRVRHQPEHLIRRRDGLDAVHPLDLGCLRG